MHLKRVRRAVCLVFALLLVPTAVFAQWLNYPTPGIPRLAGRQAESVGARASDRGRQAGSVRHLERRRPVLPLQHRAGSRSPRTFSPGPRRCSCSACATPGRTARSRKCLPVSVPFHNFFNLTRIVQTPALMVILYESPNSPASNRVHRRPRSARRIPIPTWLGYSIGRWEGDTLVVTTAGFNDKGWLDSAGHPQTESLRITERLRRRDFGHMDFEITIDDPKVFTKPFTIKTERLLPPDTELLEDVCENERDAPHVRRHRVPAEPGTSRVAGSMSSHRDATHGDGRGSAVRAGPQRAEASAAAAVGDQVHVDRDADRLRVRQGRPGQGHACDRSRRGGRGNEVHPGRTHRHRRSDRLSHGRCARS